MRFQHFNSLLPAILCASCCAWASAGFRKPSVVFLHSTPVAEASDVVSVLKSTGLFDRVEAIDASIQTPSLAQLSVFDAALVTNASPWFDRATLGNILAEYVDAGFGVVQTPSRFGGADANPTGKWQGDYLSMLFGSNKTGQAYFNQSPWPPDEKHPALIGLWDLDGGSLSIRPAMSAMRTGAYAAALWWDGIPIVSVGPKINRIDIGLYPPSSDSGEGYWVRSTDGLKLLANSLLAVIRPRVLLVAAEGASGSVVVADPQRRIRDTNLFSSVDIFDGSAATPELSLLRSYDAVLVWSNFPFHNPDALGDVLAAYVDAGGGVVTSPFASSSNRALGGRWAMGGYQILPVSDWKTGNASLGTIDYASHPIVQNVASFDGGASSYRPVNTQLTPQGFVVARWTDGTVLAAASSHFRNRADLGFYPPSGAVRSGSWAFTTDGGKLLANALLYTIKPFIGSISTSSDYVVQDVVSRLVATRRFSGVSVIHAAVTTPNAETLRPLQAVLNWSEGVYLNSVATGNALADYVDAGGGVVNTMFGNVVARSDPKRRLGGRWITQGYDIVPDAALPAYQQGPQTFLGVIEEPQHPIASLVRHFDGGVYSYRAVSNPLLRGRTILRWSDGIMLASVHNFRRRVDLGFSPVTTRVSTGNWNPQTDGARILLNALDFVMNVTPCPGDFNGDGFVDDLDFSLFAPRYDGLLDPRGDLTGDGLTDDSDFCVFIGSYERAACP